jgi:hypothetical protein
MAQFLWFLSFYEYAPRHKATTEMRKDAVEIFAVSACKLTPHPANSCLDQGYHQAMRSTRQENRLERAMHSATPQAQQAASAGCRVNFSLYKLTKLGG